MPILYIDDTTAETQLARLDELRAPATTTPCAARSTRCEQTARGAGNTMYPLLDCVRAYATVGEMCDALRDVWGEYEEVPLDLIHAKDRVVIAKPGLDGHDRGAKVIARALRDAGMEVIYTGLRQTPEQIVAAALQEDADAIGLSILSGAHMHICPRVMELLREKGLDDVLVVVGGIIPDVDIPKLQRDGREGDLPAGNRRCRTSSTFITDNVRPRVEHDLIMPHKLLLADDSVTIQRVIELTFADEDMQVIAVGDGKQAIDRIQADRPDIVLADVGMPERDGYEVAAFIKGTPQLCAHSGGAADRRVRADRREPRARRRLRRRAGQAVRAADGDQPGEGTAVGIPPPGSMPAPAPVSAVAPAAAAVGSRPPAAAPALEPIDFDRDLAPGPLSAGPEADSLEDYFDRLDAAFANMRHRSAGRSRCSTAPTSRADIDATSIRRRPNARLASGSADRLGPATLVARRRSAPAPPAADLRQRLCARSSRGAGTAAAGRARSSTAPAE